MDTLPDAGHSANDDGRVFRLGETAVTRDYSMTLVGTKDCSLGGPAPKRGFVRTGLEATLTALDDRAVPANPFYATATTQAGQTFAATLLGCDPPLGSAPLERGSTARGYITFELPLSVRRFTVRYAPPLIGAPPEPVDFVVDR